MICSSSTDKELKKNKNNFGHKSYFFQSLNYLFENVLWGRRSCWKLERTVTITIIIRLLSSKNHLMVKLYSLKSSFSTLIQIFCNILYKLLDVIWHLQFHLILKCWKHSRLKIIYWHEHSKQFKDKSCCQRDFAKEN